MVRQGGDSPSAHDSRLLCLPRCRLGTCSDFGAVQCQLRHLALSHYFGYPPSAAVASFALFAWFRFGNSASNCCCNHAGGLPWCQFRHRGHNSPFIHSWLSVSPLALLSGQLPSRLHRHQLQLGLGLCMGCPPSS